MSTSATKELMLDGCRTGKTLPVATLKVSPVTTEIGQLNKI